MKKENLETIKRQLQNLNTKFDLKFKCFRSVTDKEIVVEYYGHEVGGSYVPAEAVAPGYVNDIQYSTNRYCDWNPRDAESGGIGYDIYVFSVWPNDIIAKRPRKENPEGELLRLDHSYAFLSECDMEWSLLYILNTDLTQNKNTLLNDFGVRISNKYLVIDGEKVAKILSYEKPYRWSSSTGNSTLYRTHFKGIYDLIISKKKLVNLVYKKHEEVIRYLFNKEKSDLKPSLRHINTLCFDNGYKFEEGHYYRIFNSKDIKQAIQRYYEYQNNQDYVTLSTGKVVETKTQLEMAEFCYHSLQFQNFRGYDSARSNHYYLSRLICKAPNNELTENEMKEVTEQRINKYQELSRFQSLFENELV